MGVEIAADLPDIDHALLPLPTTGTPPEATSTHGKPYPFSLHNWPADAIRCLRDSKAESVCGNDDGSRRRYGDHFKFQIRPRRRGGVRPAPNLPGISRRYFRGRENFTLVAMVIVTRVSSVACGGFAVAAGQVGETNSQGRRVDLRNVHKTSASIGRAFASNCGARGQ